MTNSDTLPAPPDRPRSAPAGLTIRARESTDWREITALMELPRVRWGTLRMPFIDPDQVRKRMEEPPQEGYVAIVAILGGALVGAADVTPYKGRRRHAGGIGMCVHDDFQRRGIGSALLGALVDTSDNWLNLKRLELTVYVDNEPAIRLYKKFGFVVEGTRRAEAFREGRYVDAFGMARVRGL